MKSRMNKLMSLCLVAMMGTTFIPQPIQAEEVGEFEEATVEFEEATFEEESNQVAESSVESSRKTPVLDTFDDGELRYQVTGADTVEVIGFLREPSSSVLTRLFIPPTVVHKSQTYRITSIGESAFAGCTSLMSITLPDSLKTIGDSAFKDCIEIESVDLPEGLKTIGDSAFSLGKTALHGKSARLEYINIPSTVKELGPIFGEESPFIEEGTFIFQGDQPPKMDEKLLNVISNGLYKPIIYFANNESAMSAYTGSSSPFIKAGLINRDHFNSYYESFQFCPKGQTYIIRMGNFPEGSRVEVTSGDTDVAYFVYPDDAKYWVANDGLNDKSNKETILGFDMIIHGKKYTSEANKIKFIVDHDYVWQFKGFPDFIRSGSMYQKCENCEDKKESITIPSYLELLKGLIDLDDFGFDDFDDLPSIIMGINEDQEFKSNSTYEVKNESLELIPFPLKDHEMNFEQYDCHVKSSNPNVATVEVDEQGKVVVKTVGKGQAKITTSYTKKEETPAVMNESGFINEVAPNTELEGTFVMNVVESKDDIPTGGGSGGGSTGGGSGGGSTGGSTSGGSGGGSSTDSNAPTPQVENAVYRAYNPNNGEHLYTTNYGEFKVITKNGWDDEGIAFMSESKEKGQAVYRVYNPNSGLHHYTTDVNEKNALVSLGWNDEGVAFYTSKNPKDTPVYRVYNENDGNHHYTMNANEALALISMGWKNEGIAFLTAPMK